MVGGVASDFTGLANGTADAILSAIPSKWITSGNVVELGGLLQVGPNVESEALQNSAAYPLFSGPYALRSSSMVSVTGSSVYADVGFSDVGNVNYATAPDSSDSYCTSNGAAIQSTFNTAGQTSLAIYDIVWTSSGVNYYQNGVLKASHTNPPNVAMGAILEADSTTVTSSATGYSYTNMRLSVLQASSDSRSSVRFDSSCDHDCLPGQWNHASDWHDLGCH